MIKGTKNPTYKDLANYLNVSEQAVKQYPKKKRSLMIYGLWFLNDYKNKTLDITKCSADARTLSEDGRHEM